MIDWLLLNASDLGWLPSNTYDLGLINALQCFITHYPAPESISYLVKEYIFTFVAPTAGMITSWGLGGVHTRILM